MTNIRDLLEKRASLATEMRSITAAANGDGGDLSTEQSTKFDALKTQLEAVEKQIERQRYVDEIERRMSGETITGTGDGKFDRLCADVSLQKIIAVQIEPRACDASLEIEVSQELARRSGRKPEGMFAPLNAFVERRVQTIGGDAAALKQTEVLADQFIDALRPRTVLGALGARIITGLRDDISLPKLVSGPGVEWLETEGVSALTGGDHVFEGVPGTPHHAGMLTELSRKTILQTNPALEQITRNDFTRQLAAGVDFAGLTGAGSGGEPEGILNNSDIFTEAITSNAVAWENVLAMIAKILGADVQGGSLGFVFNSFCQAYLRSTLKVSGDAAAGFIMEGADRLAGYPVGVTSQMLNNTMLAGDFAQVILAFWGDAGADILVNPYDGTAYKKGNVLVRALIDMDVLIRHPEGFCKISGIDLGDAS